jgi:hypothetical protein
MKKATSNQQLITPSTGFKHSPTSTSPLLSAYSVATPADIFDLRCEYEVPRYLDLTTLDEEEDGGGCADGSFYREDNRKHSTTGGARCRPSTMMEEEFYQWFQLAHDFHVSKRFVKVDKERLIAATPHHHH